MFDVRSLEKELLDQEEIPADALFRNLRELDFINHWLGGYGISFNAFKKILKKGVHYRVADIGCGGGDTLKRLHHWNKKAGFEMELAGIDIRPVCIEYAAQNLKDTDVRLICDDYRNLFSHVENVGIIHACLFCHHLSDAELTELVRFALDHQAILVINDLERNPLAYHAIRILTGLFSKSYLVKNDAPLSVLRGFKRREWEKIIRRAGATRFSVKNKWAFRHEVIVDGNKI